MAELTQIILLATLVEGMTQFLVKDLPFIPDELAPTILRYITMGIGIACAFNAQIDIFATLGLESTIPYFGYVATGILASRGSNYIHDILSRITSVKGLK